MLWRIRYTISYVRVGSSLISGMMKWGAMWGGILLNLRMLKSLLSWDLIYDCFIHLLLNRPIFRPSLTLNSFDSFHIIIKFFHSDHLINKIWSDCLEVCMYVGTTQIPSWRTTTSHLFTTTCSIFSQLSCISRCCFLQVQAEDAGNKRLT